MPPVIRRRRSHRCCILDVVPEDLWISVLSHLLFVHDACRMKRVCRFFGTLLLHDVLELRMRILTSRPFTMKLASTLSMAHAERVWGGIRLTALDRRTPPDEATRPSDILALRGDPPLWAGRHNKNCNLVSSFVSRLHFLVKLNQDPFQNHAASVYVFGQNGMRLMPFGNNGTMPVVAGEYVKIHVGMEMEITEGLGLFYRVDYV